MTDEAQLAHVKRTVRDMDTISQFLAPHGRFVGDMVHVSIKDLAACIRAAEKKK